MEYRGFSGGFSEENGKLSITFNEQGRKGDVVEELVRGLNEIEIMAIGDAHTNEYGTCAAMFYSLETDTVYIVDLNDERFVKGETVAIEGRKPNKWDRELMKTKYKVQKIDWSKIETRKEYEKALQSCEKKICYGLKEVFAYCGVRLKRFSWGYGRFDGNIECSATRA